MTVHISPAGAASDILKFWFDEVGKKGWFSKSGDLDSDCAQRFGAVCEAVLASNAVALRDTPDQLLAAIILLDQFSRNIHRDNLRAFEGDALARELTYSGLERGWDERMTADQRQFLLMPLMHSEQIADQERSLAEFKRLGDEEALKFALMHHDQIKRFGRFPGRNQALGRVSTAEEREVIARGKTF